MSGRIYFSWTPQEPRNWRIERSYTRQTSIGPIVVPRKFNTDWASVPRVLWRRYPTFDRWTPAALIHDWLYRTKPAGVDRGTADDLFLEVMNLDRVLWGDAQLMHRTVRRFGDTAWNQHRAVEV